MSVRCKFACSYKQDAGDGAVNVTLSAVYGGSKENEEFFKYTPGGSIQFYTVNKAAADQLEIGKEYYVDITPTNATAISG